MSDSHEILLAAQLRECDLACERLADGLTTAADYAERMRVECEFLRDALRRVASGDVVCSACEEAHAIARESLASALRNKLAASQARVAERMLATKTERDAAREEARQARADADAYAANYNGVYTYWQEDRAKLAASEAACESLRAALREYETNLKTGCTWSTAAEQLIIRIREPLAATPPVPAPDLERVAVLLRDALARQNAGHNPEGSIRDALEIITGTREAS